MPAFMPRTFQRKPQFRDQEKSISLNSPMSLKLMNSVRFYDYSIDRLRCVLQWREQPVPIDRKTFDLLLYLIDHRDRLVTKDELLESLWPDQFVEESNLTQHVFLLRKALSAQGGDQKIIQVSRREVSEEHSSAKPNDLADVLLELSSSTLASLNLTTSVLGRPPVIPRAFAEARPAAARSAHSSRFIGWIAPIIEKEHRAIAVLVSMLSPRGPHSRSVRPSGSSRSSEAVDVVG
jgi:hypothetical protein